MLLISCSKTNSSLPMIKLPELPLAGKKVGEELKAVCDKDKCYNLYEWIVKLHDFKTEYNIYREELK